MIGPRDIEPVDELTLRRALKGDAGAFAALLRAHEAAARRVATVILGSQDGVDDVMQDAALRSWQRLETFEAGAPFKPWFLKVVANTAKNRHRSRGRRAAMELRARAQGSPSSGDPLDLVVLGEEHREVLDALNRLGPDDRLVLALRHFEGLDEAAMASVMDCARGTVKSRLSRATGRLRAALLAPDDTNVSGEYSDPFEEGDR